MCYLIDFVDTVRTVSKFRKRTKLSSFFFKEISFFWSKYKDIFALREYRKDRSGISVMKTEPPTYPQPTFKEFYEPGFLSDAIWFSSFTVTAHFAFQTFTAVICPWIAAGDVNPSNSTRRLALPPSPQPHW